MGSHKCVVSITTIFQTYYRAKPHMSVVDTFIVITIHLVLRKNPLFSFGCFQDPTQLVHTIAAIKLHLCEGNRQSVENSMS